MSERTQKVLQLLRDLSVTDQIWIRQATLAEHFGCSRTTIWRTLKQLKEAGLITDLNKRYQSRYKIYQVTQEVKPKRALTPAVEAQWTNYGKDWSEFYEMLDGKSGRPTIEECFYKVASELEHITNESELYSKIFRGIRALPNFVEHARSWKNEPENRDRKGGIIY